MHIESARSGPKQADDDPYLALRALFKGVLMMNDKMVGAFNSQINWELYSAYLYLSMSAYLESIGLSGFASWMRAQSQEEQVHAMKLFDFMASRGGRIELKEISKPKGEWSSPLNVFEDTLQHEKKVTGLIGDLAMLAERENDGDARKMLQWFVDEQAEEEESAGKAVKRLMLTENDEAALEALDKEMGQRVFTPPKRP